FQDQPLFGVPVSIKESIDVESMKTTGGLHYRSDLMMTENASSVNKLQEAGAIILCKTNTPSLCFCHETDNKLYRRTNNTWNKKMTAGGSSGGEAALILLVHHHLDLHPILADPFDYQVILMALSGLNPVNFK